MQKPSAEQLDGLRTQAEAALAAIETQTADQPDGKIWAARWRLADLRKQLKAAKPEAKTAAALGAALQYPAPLPLEPARRALVHHFTVWVGAIGWSPAGARQAEEDVTTLERLASRGAQPLAPADEAEVRAAFRRLAQRRVCDDLLGEYRAEHSSFNYRTQLSAAYIEEESAKQFTVPVNVRQSAGGFQIGVNGTTVAEATAKLVPNDDHGEIRIDVAAVGRFTMTGSKGRIRLQAANTQRLRSSQTMYLTPDGVETPGPRVCDRSCTALSWVSVCLRLKLVRRVVEAIAERVAAKKIAEQDPVIARKVEAGVRDKINEEGLDIAHRINGKFGRLTSEHFPDDGDKPRLTIRSTSEAMTWTALYAGHDGLGALTPPPAPPAQPLEVYNVLHESAFNNWASRLRGAYLDEATYHALLFEHVKVGSPAFEAMRSSRSAAVIRFAFDEPLVARFRDQGIDLTLRLQGYMLGGAADWSAPQTIEVRYRLAPGPQALRFVRERESFSTLAGWKEVLEQYLPAVIEPLPKYHNASFKSRLAMQYLMIADGWLATGSNRVELSPPSED